MVRIKKRLKFLLVLLLLLFVMYPNPFVLWTTVERTLQPPVDAETVRAIADELPDNPEQIERLVLTTYVPYAYDWTVYGVPWYFPSPADVLRDRRGDCEARAVFLASILEAKGIPYNLNVSPIHIWVDYRGKVENQVETEDAVFLEHKDGGLEIKLPQKVDYQEYVKTEVDALWNAMPIMRKIVLLVGLGLVLTGDFLLSFILIPLRRWWNIHVAIEKS